MTECRVCKATTSGFLCRTCTRELAKAIGDMPSLMHELSIVATKQARVYRANGRPADDSAEHERWVLEHEMLPAMLRSREGRSALTPTASPINLAARDLLWDAGNTLSTWARDIAEHHGAELPTAETLLAWLLTNVEAVRFQPAAEQIHDEITDLHRRMISAVDRSPSRIYAGPCHTGLAGTARCQRPLYAWPGSLVITCDGYDPKKPADSLDVGCLATHTVIDRKQWLLDELEHALLPLDTLRAALPALFPQLVMPAAATWRSWGMRRRLTVKSVSLGGEPLYRGGDVLALVRDLEARRPKHRVRTA